MERDAVCGMDVDPKTARHTAQHGGRTYYFCSPGCKKSFEANPTKFFDSNYKPSM